MKTALSWQQTTTVEVELDVDDIALCAWAIATLDLRTLGGEISAVELRRSAAANPHLRRRLQQLYAIALAAPRASSSTISVPHDTHPEGSAR